MEMKYMRNAARRSRPPRIAEPLRVALLLLVLLVCGSLPANAANRGELDLKVVDQETGEALPVRVHLRDARGRSVSSRAVSPHVIKMKDQLTIDGATRLALPLGDYLIEIEHGPAFRQRSGHFKVERNSVDQHTLTLPRIADLAREGWYAGDLMVARPVDDIPLLMRAEDLNVAVAITWTPQKNLWSNKPLPAAPTEAVEPGRFFHPLAIADDRAGGLILSVVAAAFPPEASFEPEWPTPLDVVTALRSGRAERPIAAALVPRDETDHRAGSAVEQTAEFAEPRGNAAVSLPAAEANVVHVAAGTPFAWDLPVWVAHQAIDSVCVLHPSLQRDADERPKEDGKGKPRDLQKYGGGDGVGLWSRDIYYQLLNCGLRIPPSAASGSGTTDNPPGYNRVYVYCGPRFEPRTWWDNLAAGKSVISNGPLLRPRVNGELPGHLFQVEEGQEVTLEIELTLSTREKIDYLEIVKNGRVAHNVRLDEFAKQNGRLPLVYFRESGWMLIRAVTSAENSYRYAASAPYYVQVGQQTRVSRAAAEFFRDWVYERAQKLAEPDPRRRRTILTQHRQAHDFWQALVDRANVP